VEPTDEADDDRVGGDAQPRARCSSIACVGTALSNWHDIDLISPRAGLGYSPISDGFAYGDVAHGDGDVMR